MRIIDVKILRGCLVRASSSPVFNLNYSSSNGKKSGVRPIRHFGLTIERPSDELYVFTKCIRIGLGETTASFQYILKACFLDSGCQILPINRLLIPKIIITSILAQCVNAPTSIHCCLISYFLSASLGTFCFPY